MCVAAPGYPRFAPPPLRLIHPRKNQAQLRKFSHHKTQPGAARPTPRTRRKLGAISHNQAPPGRRCAQSTANSQARPEPNVYNQARTHTHTHTAATKHYQQSVRIKRKQAQLRARRHHRTQPGQPGMLKFSTLAAQLDATGRKRAKLRTISLGQTELLIMKHAYKRQGTVR